MGYPTKITTCCYCGARAALVLRGKVSHELSCSSCGAPIHMMKQVPVDPVEPRAEIRSKPAAVSHRPKPKSFKKPKKKKRRKSALSWVMEEAMDALEDIFD
ncbi:hypothetical protein [Planktotalea sp.]|uniref:hypothetical protein n=1 Tax=Planktotalea sp. TaxID=2029877 RepID=UPI00329A3A51